MVSIKWCLSVKNGLKLVEPNKNMSEAYLKMGKESLGIIKEVERSKIWLVSSCYYTIYSSFYSLMMKVGVKCEIHSCSLEFMKLFFGDFYGEEDVEVIKRGFSLRGDLQYYPDRLVSDKDLSELREGAIDFFIKTKGIISMISEKQIMEIRDKFNGVENE